MDVDPDYVSFDIDTGRSQEEITDIQPHVEKTARKEVVERIEHILTEQFDKEIEIRENELALINERLTKARHIMDRLRACAVASYYAKSFTKSGAKGPGTGASQHPAIQNVLRRAVTVVLSKNPPPLPSQMQINDDKSEANIQDAPAVSNTADSADDETLDDIKSEEKSILNEEKGEIDVDTSELHKEDSTKQALGGRLRVKKTIIVGNVSKYIPTDQRESTDKSTHKWMVYVRGDKENPRIDNFVRKVWFFLHPSYRPHDIVEVAESPFHLTRRGWGEFPIRVQIHFCDRRARPVDVIHMLKLDRTYTGLQTLGAETVCEVELDQSSIQSSPTDILETVLTHIPIGAGDEKRKADSSAEAKNQDIRKSDSDDVTMNAEVSSMNGNAATHVIGENGNDRKRKIDDAALKVGLSSNTPRIKKEHLHDMETSTPMKKRRRRRVDFSPESTSLHGTSDSQQTSSTASSDTLLEESLMEDSRKNVVCEAESSISKEKFIAPDAIPAKCDSNVKSSSKSSEPQVMNLLPNKPPCDSPFRMRSASVGDTSAKRSTLDLVKSAITVSPAISVKVTASSSSSTSNKNTTFSIPKSPIDCHVPTKAIFLPLKSGDDTASKKGGEIKCTTPRSTIPLSSLLKSGSVQPVKPLVLKVGGTAQRVSPTFSINILNLGTQGGHKVREKRSLSADLTARPKLACFAPLKSKAEAGSPQLTPITQLHIITPVGNVVKPKPNPNAAISLGDLHKAFSSRKITLSPKMDSKTDNGKSSAKDSIRKEGTTQPATSPLPKDGRASFVKPKGKKLANSTGKTGADAKVSKGKENSTGSIKPKPIHQVIGEEVALSVASNADIEDLLPRIAMKVPLIREERDIVNFPFCATSESEFLEWNVGKQRASELKRSILMQDVLKYLIENRESFKLIKLPSKKFIMDWCLKHGYSIFTDEFDESDSEAPITESRSDRSNIVNTLSSSQDLVAQLEKMGKSNDDEECVMVDVTSMEDEGTCSPNKQEDATHDGTLAGLPEELTTLVSSSEIRLVEEQTRQIGIRLRHEDGLPTTHVILAKALQQFLDSLLRKSLSKRLARRDGASLQRVAPREIFVKDVVDAISSTETFDFLTDNHFASAL